jgi:Dolichyl-phosphate-mannose-protein mannosyltransferase
VNEPIFILTHYAAIALLALVAYVFGRRLTTQVRYHSNLEVISFSITLGLGVIAYLVLLLGSIGLLYSWLLLAVILVGLGLCYRIFIDWQAAVPQLWRAVKRASKRRWLVFVIGVALALILLPPIFALPLHPPTAFDATSYHLASAKIYAQEHRLVYTPDLRYPVLPQTNQMLFTLALLVYDDIFAQLVEFLMMIALVGAVIAFGQRLFSAQAGYWSSALLLGSPLVLWLGSVAYIDMGVTLFVTATIYAFSNWLQTRATHWLILSGVLCGLAIGTKSPPLFFLGILTIAAFCAGFRERRYAPPIVFAAIAFAIGLPWFARSFYYTHDPVFPILFDQFGRLLGYGHLRPEYYRDLMEAVSTAGISRAPAYLLMWQLATTGNIPPAAPPILPVGFLLLPIAIVVSIRRVRVAGLLALTIAYVIFWLLTVRDSRFLVPVLPLLGLATMGSLTLLLAKLPWPRKPFLHHGITIIGIVVLMYPGWKYGVKQQAERGPIPVNQTERDNYLSRQLQSYPAHRLLNSLGGSNYVLYTMQDENLAYFSNGTQKGDYFGPSSYSRIWDKLDNGQLLYHELKSMGANYFLVNNDRRKLDLPRDIFFESHFKPLYQEKNVRLFEIHDAAFERRVGNLVLNPDLEQVKDGRLLDWYLAGSPVVDSSGRFSHSGAVAAGSNRAADVLYQGMTVESGKNYLYSCQARALNANQIAKLQVNWYDTEGRLLREDIKVIEPRTQWQSYELDLKSPERVVTATIYASSLDLSAVWFDDFSFGTVEYKLSP